MGQMGAEWVNSRLSDACWESPRHCGHGSEPGSHRGTQCALPYPCGRGSETPRIHGRYRVSLCQYGPEGDLRDNELVEMASGVANGLCCLRTARAKVLVVRLGRKVVVGHLMLVHELLESIEV
jgi:hypothetical protein